MSSFDADVDGIERVQGQIHATTHFTGFLANRKARSFAEERKKEIVATSPVDTGDYRAAWEVKKGDERGEYLIVNDVGYGHHLVFPNRNMMGSPKADLPSAGILHNVRGIIFQEKQSLRDKIGSAIGNLI